MSELSIFIEAIHQRNYWPWTTIPPDDNWTCVITIHTARRLVVGTSLLCFLSFQLFEFFLAILFKLTYYSQKYS